MVIRSKNVRWLEGELKRWVSDGIIDDTHAQAIRRSYATEQAAPSWALIVFSGLGAVIIGLGVILLFAYNWRYMHKFLKLAVIFSAIAVAHAIGIWLFLRNVRFKRLGEALTILGTMLFGAGIWLVAQIYHIQEHFPTAFLFWGLGALALAWAMPSIAQAVMAAVLFTIWAAVESVAFERAMHAAPLIILLLGLLAYLQRSRLLLGVILLALGVSITFVTFAGSDVELAFRVLLSVVAIYLSLGLLAPKYGKFAASAPIFQACGFTAYVVILYLLTFPYIAGEILSAKPPFITPGVIYWLLLFILALAAWIIVAWSVSPWAGGRLQLKDLPYDFFIIPLLLVLCYMYSFFIEGTDKWMVAAPFNLAFLAHAGSMMARGCKHAKLNPVILGSLLLIALIFARYMDLFESLVTRGLIFIVVGAVLFAQGFFYVRSKRKQIEVKNK